jgi:glycosyltransferase involved in cell wall biosynthesis/peptidoglycan/xylan/chitin deacetylase (PgdA/CDA1 family)
LCEVAYDGPLEVIVVVDGSTDGTEEAVKALPCASPKTVIIQRNTGLAGARNRGAAEAGGDILLFLDDDMMAAPDLVQQHARSHLSGCDVVLGHIPLDACSPKGFLAAGVSGWAEQRAARLQRGEPTLFDLVSGHLSIKRKIFEAVGGYDESFTEGGTFGDEDLDFAVRLRGANRICFNPDAIASQRYVVTPRQYLRQWAQAARSDVRFARKHPAHASELFKLHGRDRWTTRLLLRPLATIPGIAGAFAAAASWIAELEPRFPQAFQRAFGKLFSTARDLLYWRAVRKASGMPSSRRVLVLCYHAVDDLTGDPVLSQYGVAPKIFGEQLDSLLRRGFSFISPDEFELLLTGRGRVPDRAVLITFDDCYEELTDAAREILQPRRIEGIAFAVSGMKSDTNEWDQRLGARTLRLLGAPGLRELSDRGLEIGCHSRSHTSMTTLPDSALASETQDAAVELAALGLPRPRFFAYPHGANDERARAAVQRAGFVAAFGLTPSRASPRSDRFAVPRVEILARDTGWRFWLKTAWPRLSVMLHPDPIHVRVRRRIARVVTQLRAQAS